MEFKTEFFKELYYKELESKELQANRFTTNISLVTLLFAGLFFCLKNINDIADTKYFNIFILIAVISLVLDVAIVILLLKHLSGSDYSFLESPKKLNDHYKVLEDHAKKYNQNAEELFKNYIHKIYVESADHNFGINDKRIKTMVIVNNLIVSSVITTLISLSYYVPSFFKEDANTQKVEIIESKNEKPEKAVKKEVKVQEEVQNEKR